ncbi:K+/H+ antiporter subunit F [Alcanivorax sp. 1008]|uniref:K+/H+ antiporter subunit F n=1 Tax=Alcanivorax sp. 1008 TaxID=2816853 RepID=UPI001DDB6453|nr:K+/H+ antiporter subunit F [Alcanivorax sp. 1008]MCC1496046.1 K+/H+ antiporter subunit F [Alcanivorax sp. 1008]
MLSFALNAAFVMVGIAMLLGSWRVLVGPSLTDRVLALDTLYINSIALIVLFGIYLGTSMYFEAALLIALIGFVSTVAVAKYLLRGDIIE